MRGRRWIFLSDYLVYASSISDFRADLDKDGKAISGTKKEKVVKYIKTLDIPKEQKTWLYLAQNYGESGLKEIHW